jgi:hypothetical protein
MLCFDINVLVTVFLVYVHVLQVQSSGATNPPVRLIMGDS